MIFNDSLGISGLGSSTKQTLYSLGQEARESGEVAQELMDSILNAEINDTAIKISSALAAKLDKKWFVMPDGVISQFRTSTVGSGGYKLTLVTDSGLNRFPQADIAQASAEGDDLEGDLNVLEQFWGSIHQTYSIDDWLETLSDSLIKDQMIMEMASGALNLEKGFNPTALIAKYSSRPIPMVQTICDSISTMASTGDPDQIVAAIRSGLLNAMTALRDGYSPDTGSVSPTVWDDYERSSWINGIWTGVTDIATGTVAVLETLGKGTLHLLESGWDWLVSKVQPTFDKLFGNPAPSYNFSSGDTFFHAMATGRGVSSDSMVYSPFSAMWHCNGDWALALRSSPNNKFNRGVIRNAVRGSEYSVIANTGYIPDEAYFDLVAGNVSAEDAKAQLVSLLEQNLRLAWNQDFDGENTPRALFNWEWSEGDVSSYFFQSIGYWRSLSQLIRSLMANCELNDANIYQFINPAAYTENMLPLYDFDSTASIRRGIRDIEEAIDNAIQLVDEGARLDVGTELTSTGVTVGHIANFDNLRAWIKAVPSMVAQDGITTLASYLRVSPYVYYLGPIQTVDVIDPTWQPFLTPPKYSRLDWMIMSGVKVLSAAAVTTFAIVATTKLAPVIRKFKYRRALKVDQTRAAYLANPTDKQALNAYTRALAKSERATSKAIGGVGASLSGLFSQPNESDSAAGTEIGSLQTTILRSIIG